MFISQAGKKSDESPVFFSMFILLIGSYLPSLLAYPIPHAVAEPTILTLAFLVPLSFRLVFFISSFQIKRKIYALLSKC